MDGPEPEFSYAAVSAQTTKFGRVCAFSHDRGALYFSKANVKKLYTSYLDKSTPFTLYRWLGTATLFIVFSLRILLAEGWYIGVFISTVQPT